MPAASSSNPYGLAVGTGLGVLSAIATRQDAAKSLDYNPVDLAEEQKKAMSANLGAEKSIEQLIAQANKFQQGQATGLMEQAIPGWGKLQQGLTGLATDITQNPYDVPKDVENNLARIAAERGISAGTRGQFNDFSLLRDFGVNALQYGQSRISQAQGLAQTLAQLAPRINPMSPLSFYVTPQQQASVTQQNNAGALQQQQAGENSKTAANNYNRQNGWDNVLQGVAAAYAGGF